MSRRVALVLTLVGVAVVTAPASGARRLSHAQVRHPHVTVRLAVLDPPQPIVGISGGAAGWGDASTGPRLDRIIAETGSRWLRDDVSWSVVEPRPGEFDFSYYDHFMRLVAERGMLFVAIPDGAPSWAGDPGATIPANVSAYAQFVAALVGRYGPHGTFWSEHPELGTASAIRVFELLNEPYYDDGKPGDYNPARYARLLKAAVSAGRAVDPDVRFLLPVGLGGRKRGTGWEWWADALYRAMPNLGSYFDGVSIHPYGTDVRGLRAPGYDELRSTELIHADLVAHGAGGKPMWITEVGYSTCQNAPACVSDDVQAQNLRTVFSYVRGRWRQFVKAVFVYRFDDLGGNVRDSEGYYGLVRQDGSPKPALSVFQAAARSAYAAAGARTYSSKNASIRRQPSSAAASL